MFGANAFGEAWFGRNAVLRPEVQYVISRPFITVPRESRRVVVAQESRRIVIPRASRSSSVPQEPV